MDTNALKLKFKYSELVDIWESFCDHHRALYELTAAEYEALLESKVEKLEQLINDKEEIIQKINVLDGTRQNLINEISELSQVKIEKLNDLYPLVKKLGLDPNNTIEKYNALLLDIINNIQEQNKKNQVFLNKAILSLQSLKEQFRGKKSYKTYNNKGNTLSP